MTILWINLALVFVFALSARYFATPVTTMITPATIRPNKVAVFFCLVSLVLVSGLRQNIGDTYFYKYAYDNNVINWEYVTSQKDIGFGILQMLLQQYVSKDSLVLIFTTALITNILIITVLYKYSRMIEISLYVYITGGFFLVSMNGIRQVLASAILFTGIKFIIEGKWFYYILVVLFASTFHQSALVLIPIYFLVRYKAWSRTTFILLVCSIVIVFGFDQFSSLLFSAIEDTQYGGYKEFAEGGASIIRVAVDAVPLVLAYLGRDKLRKIFPESDYIVNMALIGFVFMIISTQNWIFARFSIYFSLYHLVLISWVLKVFREKDQKLIYFGLILCYLIYYFYENVINLNVIYRSKYLDFFS
ncbi:EpsG family protein [Robertmurraya yapensis]|uniref:EpsG family protein n=2 Tax=Bacillaceae TaxID=186817 RepID=A0A431W3K9_9BACI|nr:EpsG family protein [Bacillus yapensis]RTR30018.1 EpsG family protein [Bacillus yapensis]TKS95099.1 EpsG family protein [Bacillus yapensis]